jgi:hypothetical protein
LWHGLLLKFVLFEHQFIDTQVLMTSSNQRPPLPAGTGTAMPSNPFDLMKQLRAAGKSDNAKVKSQTQANRLLKQELRSQLIESRLMESEDYTYTEEGARRERAFEDRINM